MNIIVTGGCGFIGRLVVKDILKNISSSDQIILLDHLKRHGEDQDLNSLLTHPQVKFIKTDLSTQDFIKDLPSSVDRLYHLAAMVGVQTVMDRPAEVLKSNTLSTMNIFDWFVKHASPQARLLFASSSEVYSGGEILDDFPVPTPENVPWVISDPSNPRFSYALSKMWGEAYGRYLSGAMKQKFFIVRYHNVYGPNMGYAHVIPQVVGRVKRKEDPFKIISPEQTRSFCWVNDAAQLTHLVMESQQLESGAVVHIGNGAEETKIGEVYEKIFNFCQWRPRHVQSLPAQPGSVNRRCPDISTLRRVVDWKEFTSFDQGLQTTVQWYMENSNGSNS